MTVYNVGDIYLEDLSGGTSDQLHILAQTDNIADGAVTTAKLAGDVTDVFDTLDIRHFNLFDKGTIIPGTYLSGTGNLLTNEDFFTSDYIDVSGYDSLTFSYTHIAWWYDENKAAISQTENMVSLNADTVNTVPENARYLRFSTYNTHLDTAQIGENVTRNDYIGYSYYALPTLVTGRDSDTSRLDLLNYTPNGNLYNSHNLISGYYINPANGVITQIENTAFAYSPSYIEVTGGEQLCANLRAFIAYYDEYLHLMSGAQFDSNRQTTVPAGARYARFSCSSVDHSTVVVMRGATVDTGIGAYSFELKGLQVDLPGEVSTITVDASGGGDYTSFTEAVYDSVDSGQPIVVMPGTYDIRQEYTNLFGQEVMDSLSNATAGINGFQNGVRISNRTVSFQPGAHLVFDATGMTVDGTHRVCAIASEPGAYIVGLDLECTGTWYCVHDDYGTPDNSPYEIRYENCRIVGHGLVNANCIGGGCHKFSRHILNNCYLNNNVESGDLILTADARYHNTSVEGAEPEVYVYNCYFSNNFNVSYYGPQTSKMRAYVNNCHARLGINKVRESSAYDVDNVDLYAWNNQSN